MSETRRLDSRRCRLKGRSTHCPSTLIGPSIVRSRHLVNRKLSFVIVIYTIIYFALTLTTAALKPFWYDELFTWVIATRSSLAEMLRALQQGWDLQPPLYYLLVRAGRALAESELG